MLSNFKIMWRSLWDKKVVPEFVNKKGRGMGYLAQLVLLFAVLVSGVATYFYNNGVKQARGIIIEAIEKMPELTLLNNNISFADGKARSVELSDKQEILSIVINPNENIAKKVNIEKGKFFIVVSRNSMLTNFPAVILEDDISEMPTNQFRATSIRDLAEEFGFNPYDDKVTAELLKERLSSNTMPGVGLLAFIFAFSYIVAFLFLIVWCLAMAMLLFIIAKIKKIKLSFLEAYKTVLISEMANTFYPLPIVGLVWWIFPTGSIMPDVISWILCFAVMCWFLNILVKSRKSKNLATKVLKKPVRKVAKKPLAKKKK